MLTEFKRIPGLFVDAYRFHFETWAREYRARGPRQAIRFENWPGAPVLLDGEGRPIEKGAWLTAELDESGQQPVMIVQPASDADEELIARHCRDLQGRVLQ